MTYKERLGDRRGDLRFEIIGQLWGSLETVEHMVLRNLARGGALVESRTPVGTDAVRSVRLVFADRASEIQVRVRHVSAVQAPDGDRYLMGLEFIDPSAAALEQIDRVVSAALGGATPVAEA